MMTNQVKASSIEPGDLIMWYKPNPEYNKPWCVPSLIVSVSFEKSERSNMIFARMSLFIMSDIGNFRRFHVDLTRTDSQVDMIQKAPV